MKKLFNLFASAIVILCALTSCGSSKESATLSPGVAKFRSPAQIYAEESLATRAWSQGTRLNENVAANIAEANARAIMARNIENAIQTALEQWYKDNEKSTVNDSNSQRAYDASSEHQEHIGIVTSQVMKDVARVKYNAYLQKNGETTVYVCMEYLGGANKLAESVTERVFEEVIKDQIPAEDKDRMEAEREKFKNNMYGSLNNPKN